ncbi:3-methyl-2-oxobutanoate hydroxymethyltransferase, partial [Shewanella algae]|uniref:3-methyl-2-oxobutanoate hydroxymethyltransferase n=1 Tax=Shewanella algae TaxID=38313 RepID=UPI00313D43C1
NPARLSRLRAIVAAGIPVVGHVGLTPQTATALGGLRAQGRTADDAIRVARDALAVQDAGAFALVIEAVPADVVDEIRRALRIPVIGIGAGAAD